jgi:cytochrome P450/nitrite reductase/ring-hydroxylating ferredoxin subunit
MPRTATISGFVNRDSWKRVARAPQVRGAGPHAVAADGVDVVLVRTASGLRAFEGRCPHRGALLGEGELSDGMLVCRNHRWRFDVETGRRDGGPECLVPCAAREEDGEILIEVSALVRPKDAAKTARRRFQDLDGPRQLPLIGSSHLIKLNQMHLQFEAWARQFGTPYSLSIGPRKIVVFADVGDMMPVLRDRPEAFTRGSNLAPIFKELGVAGVFSAEGPAWRPQRRLSMEALSHRHLRAFFPTLAGVAERLRARWIEAAKNSEVLDLPEELKRFTVDVTTQLAFGYDLDTLGKDDDVIQKKLGLLFPTFNRRLFTALPWWRLFRTPADRAVDRAVAEIRDWLRGLVNEARARLAADPSCAENPGNFLEAMLTARDENGKSFDDETIIGNAMTMLLAGEDTTAYTLAWSVHHLLEAPREVSALTGELRDVIGDAAVPPTIELTDRLAYASGVANETMRLRPVAPLFFLEATADTVVGDVEIPAGMVVALIIRAPATNAANFEMPAEFRPSRWLDDRRPGGAHEPSAHQPFGSGPRICPGRTLAMLEMKMVLATIYQNFEVERVGAASDVREKLAFTMSPVGLKVRLRQRSHVAS